MLIDEFIQQHQKIHISVLESTNEKICDCILMTLLKSKILLVTLFVLRDRVSGSPGQLRIHYIAEDDLKPLADT